MTFCTLLLTELWEAMAIHRKEKHLGYPTCRKQGVTTPVLSLLPDATVPEEITSSPGSLATEEFL